AIELAASCRPFRKSNTSAMPISAIRMGRASVAASMRVAAVGTIRRSDVFCGDSLQRVGDVVTLVDDVLYQLVELLAIDVTERVDSASCDVRAQVHQTAIERFVGAVLDLA